MASKTSRRSFSFELLANNSPGDGDSVNLYGNDFMADEKSDKPRRRRRKNRNRKTSAGDLSPISPIPDGSGSPTSSLNRGPLPPLPNSGPAFGVDSFVYPSYWPLGISPTDSSPSVSADSPNGSISLTSRPVERGTSSLGVVKEYGSGSPTGWDYRDSNQLDSAKRLASVGSELSRHGVEDSSRLRETSEENLGHRKEEIFTDTVVNAIENAALLQGASDRSPLRSLSFREKLPPEAPDFTAANGGIVEPSFAPGALYPPTELRQRLVEKSLNKHNDDKIVEDVSTVVSTKQRSRTDSNPATSSDEHATPPPQKIRLGTFATPQLKDWERLMAANNHPPPVELSPLQYIRGEVFGGSTLRNTNAAGSDQRREQVYNTMFHVPWRCELLIDVGFFVCLDAFLSLLTVMPARIIMYVWQHITNFYKRSFTIIKDEDERWMPNRNFQRPVAAELCDYGCLIVLVVGVAVLRQADISIIYHWIRCQGIVKLYVIFNVLEIFDKLCQSFGADVLQVLFNSAMSLESCRDEDLSVEMARFALDQCIAIVTYLVHALIIISQAVTLSAAVNAQNNALLTLLISNNFAEIKSNVFKRMGTDQLHKMAYHDTVERFHILTHMLFVWAQNVENAEESLWLKFFYNAGMVFCCEMIVDVIKHSFLAKFNEVKPATYSKFLQALCTQTLNSQSHEVHKTMAFVPLAPACVVMRILFPVYAACIPEGSFWWRWPVMILLGGGTYAALSLLKIVIGLSLQIHARWYLKRHPWTAPHPHHE